MMLVKPLNLVLAKKPYQQLVVILHGMMVVLFSISLIFKYTEFVIVFIMCWRSSVY